MFHKLEPQIKQMCKLFFLMTNILCINKKVKENIREGSEKQRGIRSAFHRNSTISKIDI
jgi:hypothetical protein